MTEPPPRRGSRLLRVIAIVWVAMVSAVAVIDRVALDRLAQRVERDFDYEQLTVRSLEERLATLENGVDALQNTPHQVSQKTFTEARRALDDRLNEIDHSVRKSAQLSDLLPLQERLNILENRLARARTQRDPATAVVAPKPAPTDAPLPDPPFTVLGIESRGSQRVLALLPAGVYSLDRVRVLQPGELYEDWQLESIDGNGALFRVAGRMQRVTAP